VCKVLLVDDEVFARQGLRQFIDWRAYGFDTVLEADNGEEALERIEKDRPELVVTDIRMPVLDGLDLIREVKERDLQEPLFIIVSGYSDFKYAQQAVRFGVQDFILKPIDKEELTGTLDRLVDQLRLTAARDMKSNETKFEELLAGRADAPLLLELAVAMGIVEGHELRYCIVEVNDLPYDAEDADSFRRHLEIKETLARRIAEYAGHPAVLLHEQQRGVFGFVAAGPRIGDKAECDRFLWGLQRRLSAETAGAVTVYAGAAANRLDQVKESFRTANEARLRKYALPDGRTAAFEDAVAVPIRYVELEEALIHRLLEAVEEFDAARMEEAVSRIFESFREQRFAPEAVGTSLARCAMGIVRTVQQMGGDERELALLPKLLQALKRPMTLARLRELFNEFVAESAACIAERRKTFGKGGIHKIKQYIEAHYRENISLKTIAAKFYMNPVYLGQLFKKAHGMYFNEFLLQYRVQEAKKLLRQTELRVYEIADRVGFTNADYFVAQFEKVEGKTPTEYRTSIISK